MRESALDFENGAGALRQTCHTPGAHVEDHVHKPQARIPADRSWGRVVLRYGVVPSH
jgi:hypothetical protein